ncbi:MAG: SDR family oxidoreductase [Neisseriales bacterium]|nr:MAG: SDR family oxidoreductase [Neisseriales bacterium]
MQKKVIVTGGASGIGKSIAELFLNNEHQVIILDINPDPILDWGEKFKGLVNIFKTDVSNFSDLEKTFIQIKEIWEDFDILINNAGISIRHGSFMEITPELWQKVINVNLNSVFYVSKLGTRLIKDGGCILNMSSINALAAFPHYADYNASKAGIIALTKTMAVELSERKIRVNALCPGAVLTPMQEAEYSPEMIEQVNQNILLRRHSSPEEISNFAYFLSSEQASFITGHYYLIDGGEMCRAIL